MLGTSLIGWRMPTFDEIKRLAIALAPTIQTPESHYGYVSGVYANEFKMLGSNVPNHFYGIYENNNVSYGLSLYSTNSSAPNTLSSGEMYFGYNLASHGGGYRGGSTGLDVFRVYEGVYLVSDGGTTLSSLNDPMLNANNPNSPANQQPVPVNAPVSLLALALIALGFRKQKMNQK